MFSLSRSERFVIGAFAALALVFFFLDGQIYAWLKSQHPLVAILAYLIVNPAYALFLWFAFRLNKWEGVFAAAFVVAAFDLAFFATIGLISLIVETAIPGQVFLTRVVLPVGLLVVAAFVSQNERGLFSELVGL